jgi:hypothetical protein
MTIFIDFHDLPEGLTAKYAAEMHQADFNIEHKYNTQDVHEYMAKSKSGDMSTIFETD